MIYFDNNATTPLSAKVKEAIINNLDLFENPSSLYKEAKTVKEKISQSREAVAKLVGANANNIIFTGCATESNNTVINSCIDCYGSGHIIVSSVEHSAVIETVKMCECKRNIKVTYLPVDSNGKLNLEELRSLIRNDTILVSVMMVNNEMGNIYPIKDIVNIVRTCNPHIKVHTDAVQAIGKIKVDVMDLGVDFLTISAHKFNAPKGVGALYVKDINSFVPYMRGGHQENGHRAGTENTISIIAMGIAAQEVIQDPRTDNINMLRSYLESQILKKVAGSKIIGDVNNRVCNTSCIMIKGFSGVDICEVINRVGNICISSGSACNSIETEASHVMKAMGYSTIPIRVSLGRYSTKEEVDQFCLALLQTLNILRRS